MKKELANLIKEAKEKHIYSDEIAQYLIERGVVIKKHGVWIDKPTGAYRRMQSWCSACGKHSGIGGIESNRHKPYCPNCGAEMMEADNG